MGAVGNKFGIFTNFKVNNFYFMFYLILIYICFQKSFTYQFEHVDRIVTVLGQKLTDASDVLVSKFIPS